MTVKKPTEPISPFLELDREGNIRIYRDGDHPFLISKSRGELLALRKELVEMGEIKDDKRR